MKSIFLLILLITQLALAANDLYSTLGVAKTSTEEDIKKAYQKLARKFHPDLWMQAPKEQKDKYEEKFKEMKSAYEILIDPEKRAQYDSINSNYSYGAYSESESTEKMTIEDLKASINSLLHLKDEIQILEKLHQLNKFGDLVAYNYEAFKYFYDSMISLIDRNTFSHLSTAQLLIQITASWSYKRYIIDGQGIDWSSFHNSSLARLIYAGHSLPEVLEMLGHVEVVSDMRPRLAGMRQFEANLQNYDGRVAPESSAKLAAVLKRPFRINETTPQHLIVPMLATRQIQTGDQFRAAVASMKAVGRHLDLRHKLLLSLSGSIQYVFPFIQELHFEDLMDLTKMVGRNPIDGLALLEIIFESQHKQKTLTAVQITKLVASLSDGLIETGFSVNPETQKLFRNKRPQAIRQIGDFDKLANYLSAHKGHSSSSLSTLVKNAQSTYPNSSAIPEYIETRILFPYVVNDIIELLTLNKDLWSDAKKSPADWASLHHAFGMNSLEFKTRLVLSNFRAQSATTTRWAAMLPLPQYKETTGTHTSLQLPYGGNPKDRPQTPNLNTSCVRIYNSGH